MAESKGSRTDTIVKVVLVFFISLLSFSIGTFVGKKFSDNQHRLAAMEPSAHGNTAATTEGHGAQEATAEEGHATEARDVASENAMPTEEQLAKMADEFVSDDPNVGHAPTAGAHDTPAPAAHGEKPVAAAHNPPAPAAHATTPAPTPKPVPTAASTHDEIAAVAAKLAAGAPTHEAPKPQAGPRYPTSLPKEVAQTGVGQFTVQIASFPSEAEAEKRAAELKEKGFSAFYTPATVKGQNWYRVNVGLFTTAKQAQDFKIELSAKANITTAIIQKITQ